MLKNPIRQAQTAQGTVQGIPGSNPAYTVFKGIPYAAPPVGDLRWHAPQPPAPWQGVRICDTFPPRAMQGKTNPGDFYQKEFFPVQAPCSEDCLYLNIWTPAEADATEKLPVMVWIHGGAYLGGFGHEMEFDGEGFCRRDVILVTINYRLGALGYFAHPALTAAHGTSGNYGLLDQIQALKWVNENIAVFGGDGGNVTVFGQSAGGGSVLSIITSPLAQGLVSRAIIQSANGVDTLGGPFSLAEAEDFGEAFVGHMGLDFEAFRQLPAETLIENAMPALMAYNNNQFALKFMPCTDGQVLPQDPGEAIAQGKHMAIPYMTGLVTGDTYLFGQKEIDWLKLKAGDNPLYVYTFDHAIPGEDNPGAFHSSELWYIFGTLSRCWRPMTGVDYDLSVQMADMWTNFAKGVPLAAEWVAHTSDNPYIMPLGSKGE